MKFNERIKNRRKELGVTQEDLAKQLYVSRQTLSSWENGRTLPDIDSLVLLSEALEVNIDVLIKGDGGLKDNIVIRSNIEKKIEEILEYVAYALLFGAIVLFKSNVYAYILAMLLIFFSEDIARKICEYFIK